MESWFDARGWEPYPYQRDAWGASRRGVSGLLVVPTGAGKTYGAFMGPLMDLMERTRDEPGVTGRLHTLYITPLRAVTRDIEKALRAAVSALCPGARVETRTGDTSAGVRARQRERLPEVLLTTPESLSLLLTHEESDAMLGCARFVIVDEWHELMASKRGTQLELALARLRILNPSLRTWGMSATIGNARDALDALCGREGEGVIITSRMQREVVIESVVPEDPARLPWAGHLGLRMLPEVLAQLEPSEPTLVFTNTRSQAERWFAAIRYARPEWQHLMALHHGSLDRAERERVEQGLKEGSVRIVVATSSLDLGVDFSPVRRVMQIGSPKGVARLIQRAGRANHHEGGVSVVRCVPTHAMELLEIVAAREAALRGEVESRRPPRCPIDVLAQHMVTRGLGGGFRAEELYEEVRGAYSYRGLSRAEFDWALGMVTDGGVLRRYPEFRRLERDATGVYRGANQRAARLHRLNVGTITGAETLDIRSVSGRRLGSIDEGFVAHLRPGEKFVFAGKALRFVEVRDLTVLVRPATGTSTNTPLWAGTRLPISESLGAGLRRALQTGAALLARGELQSHCAEYAALARLLEAQSRLSALPGEHEVLIEIARTREGWHLFVFPFEGRLVHAGLASVVALRMARARPGTFAIAANDYGFEVLSAEEYAFEDVISPAIFMTDGLADDVAASVNMTQLARLAFREIARVAGLVTPGHPGARKTGRQIQAGAGLVYDVLSDFDPANLLLEQARREVLERHFEQSRLRRTMERIRASDLVVKRVERPTPMSFPLVIERVATRLSTRSVEDRIEAMQREWALRSLR